jgi:lysophospholipase L1-like esterase
VTEANRNSTVESAASGPIRLPRRDYFLLPLMSLVTILVMVGGSETLARMITTSHRRNQCQIEDPIAGDRYKPNCTARLKNLEGPWATYHYNECGYRSATSCGPKPPGTVRIAVIGSSVSVGAWVPYEETFFARTAGELSRSCNRPVDVQNLGVTGLTPISVYHRVQDVLALKPDVVVYLVTPWDITRQIDPEELAERNNPTRIPSRPAVVIKPNLPDRSRAWLLAQYFLFQNRDMFLGTMSRGDDYLLQPFTAELQQQYADFDLIIGDLTDKLQGGGIPLVLVPVPSRKEAAFLSSRELPAHVDPFAFGREVVRIASKHGAGYVDLMGPFSRIPHSEKLYYVVDGHPNADAQKVIAQNLLQKLQDGSIPAFSRDAVQNTAAKKRTNSQTRILSRRNDLRLKEFN